MKQGYATSTLGRIYIWILLAIFGGIVLHAPLTVGLGVLWPDYSLLIKSWKEVLMLIAGVIALFLLYRHQQFKLLKDPMLIIIEVYATLHLVLLLFLNQGWQSGLAGLVIDLRYILFFVLVYIALKLFPDYRRLFIKIGAAGALIVLVFALMQFLVLPRDILKYIGYGADSISPYLTIDKNDMFVRINSTLRGPNPLGAYAGIVLVLVAAAVLKNKVKNTAWALPVTVTLTVGGIVALWASYSRTAWAGAVIATIIVIWTAVSRKLSAKVLAVVGILLLIVCSGIFVARDSQFVSNVLFHKNPNGGSQVKSDDGHVKSLNSGFGQLVAQPLGSGIGSTGSASLLGDQPEVIENQYLFTAHEVGWLGLGLFLFIFLAIMRRLWDYRKDWLALGVFASGVGLALIGMLLPVWVDDTVAIVWWGLAAVALVSSPPVGSKVIKGDL